LPDTRFTAIELLDVIDSTNRLVAERAAAGGPDGLVVAAEFQTAGRGRLDRSWESEPGTALLVSVLLHPGLLHPGGLPASRWHLVSAAAGLAARQACQRVGGFSPDLKWPNDLLVGDRKLAGVLAEAVGATVVIGMGCNVHGAPEGAAWADAAAGRRVDRSDLLGAWLAGLDGYLGPAGHPGSWDAVAADYAASCATVGRSVVVERGTDSLVGLAEAIDAEGRLVVRGPDGSVVVVAAGDVTHVRPAEGGKRDGGAGEG
jgi:BirA family biotin operon repressor/biotin-[acetyl-CoA-carboxylase] ligase